MPKAVRYMRVGDEPQILAVNTASTATNMFVNFTVRIGGSIGHESEAVWTSQRIGVTPKLSDLAGEPGERFAHPYVVRQLVKPGFALWVALRSNDPQAKGHFEVMAVG